MSLFLKAEPVYAFTYLLTLIILFVYSTDLFIFRIVVGRERVSALFSIIFTCLLSTAEFIGVYLDFLNNGHVALHTAVKFFEISMTPAFLIALGLLLNSKQFRIRCIAIPIVLSVVFEAIMLPKHLVFYVDESGIYHHGRFYWCYIALVVLGALFLCCEFIIQEKRLQSTHCLDSILTVLLPLICFVAHLIVPEIRMSWLGVCIAIVFVYSARCSVKLCTDSITRLLDRRCFDYDLRKMKTGDTLIFFDINKFKQLNDEHGHTIGDEYLYEIASFIREAYDKVGRCYRIGGDEFAVIIDKKGADVNRVNETFVSLLDKERKTDPLLPRISIGTCTYTGNGQTQIDVFNTADMRMYSNKSEGSCGVD